MEWKTENLSGRLVITKDGEHGTVYHQFEIPARSAVGPAAKQNILKAAGVFFSVRCLKHSTSLFVDTCVLPMEYFCFRNSDHSDINYEITLENDFQSIRFDASADLGENFSNCIMEVTKRKYDEIQLRFCSNPGRVIHLISQVTEIQHLYLFNCHSDCEFPIFLEIGHLDQLKGLCLHGVQGDFKLSREAVEELQKLKNLETLSIRSEFPISPDALPELGKLKTLKALHLDLWTNFDAEISSPARTKALSFLTELEKLEVLTLHVRTRLSPSEMTLPPNLKYLSINNKVYHLPIRSPKHNLKKILGNCNDNQSKLIN